MTSAISAQGVGKKYEIGAVENAPYQTIRDALSSVAKSLVQGFAGERRRTRDQKEFWALRDISFVVEEGERIGIVGKNGAGKSTLLKLLSRITAPTLGRIQIRGRVASLLEVGTGFHPELSGRENIFLNGAILGMKRKEVQKKFDDIVEFSGVSRFVDTPVKHYSSGMTVRLAFAVAAHLEPDILIVDEVLAVGDADFQRKCIQKMQTLTRQDGRTVLLVSHSMTSLLRLCDRGILLERGRVVMDGPVQSVADAYLSSGPSKLAERIWQGNSGPGDDVARLVFVRAMSGGKVGSSFDIRAPIILEVEYFLFVEADVFVALSFFNDEGTALFVSPDWSDAQFGGRKRPAGLYRAQCTVPGNLLAEGGVRVTVEVSTREPAYRIHFLEQDALAMSIVDEGGAGSVRASWPRQIPGVMRPALDWRSEHVDLAGRSR